MCAGKVKCLACWGGVFACWQDLCAGMVLLCAGKVLLCAGGVFCLLVRYQCADNMILVC